MIQAKVYRYFNILVCGDDVAKGKPDPEIFLKAASELMCPPSECLIFEDSPNGLAAAAAAGGIPIFIQDIKEPEPGVKALAFRAYDAMTEFLDDFAPFTPKLPMPKLNEQFPLNDENITAGIHGFGAIGGGYLAPIFSHWDGYTRPRRIIGATRNQLMIHLVNALGKYRIRYESQAYFQTISPVCLIHMDDEAAMCSMYTQSDIIGLALPENAIRQQAGTIASGLRARYASLGKDLTILIAMNKTGAARFVRQHVKSALTSITDTAETEQILARTRFVETVVNRMVMPVSEDFLLSKFQNDLYLLHHNMQDIFDHMNEITRFFLQMAKSSEHKRKKLQTPAWTETEPVNVSKSLSVLRHLSDAVNEVTNTMFIAEPDMPLYAASGSPVVDSLRQVIVVEDIRSLQEIKNKLSNGTHAVIAWYSMLLGYQTIGQGMGDPRVESLARRMMKQEIMPALLKEAPQFDRYIQDFIGSFIKRCRKSFKDRCSRVGRDVLRKLQREERIIGTIRLSQSYGITTDGLEFGAACAILNCVLAEKPVDAEAKKVKSLYAAHHSVADVLSYSGDYHRGLYKGLDREADHGLIMRVQSRFDALRESLDHQTAGRYPHE